MHGPEADVQGRLGARLLARRWSRARYPRSVSWLKKPVNSSKSSESDPSTSKVFITYAVNALKSSPSTSSGMQVAQPPTLGPRALETTSARLDQFLSYLPPETVAVAVAFIDYENDLNLQEYADANKGERYLNPSADFIADPDGV